jgi:uncharacterized membrane protein YfcA
MRSGPLGQLCSAPRGAIGLLLPVAWAGVWAGHRVHVRMAPATVVRVVGAVLMLSGVSLTVRAL